MSAMRWLSLGLSVATVLGAPLLRAAPAECTDAPPAEAEPFSVRDNLVTGVAVSVDAGAGMLLHTLPALVLIPVLAVAADAALANQDRATLPLPTPMVAPAVPVLVAVALLLFGYGVSAPWLDALVVLSVRAVDQRRFPSWRHATAVLAASYLSLPVALVGTLGAVTFIGLLTQPEPPSFIPTRESVAGRAKGAAPTREQLQRGAQTAVFVATVTAVLVLVRPLALALFERAGSFVLPAESSARPAPSPGSSLGDQSGPGSPGR